LTSSLLKPSIMVGSVRPLTSPAPLMILICLVSSHPLVHHRLAQECPSYHRDLQ
jgi:hypothetical protein